MSSEVERLRLYVAIAVSGVVLAVALYVILAPSLYQSEHSKWAFGTVGLVLGYWLK